MPLGNPSEYGGCKIDIYAPREAADLVVVHNPACSEMHNTFFGQKQARKTISALTFVETQSSKIPVNRGNADNMKAVIVNGSPRKNWTTAKMLKSVMQGIIDSGAEAEFINLYDEPFKGCVSCFACKRKDSKCNGLCAFKDPLTPILKKSLDADIIVAGSPIYFDSPTGLYRSYMERLLFPILSYNGKYDPETNTIKSEILKKKIPSALAFTMGQTPDGMKEHFYPEMFENNRRFLESLLGYCETICSFQGYQFSDYSRYDVAEFVEPMRAKYRSEKLPEDLKKAYEIGKRLVLKAEEYR